MNDDHHMQAALQRRNAILVAMAQLGWASPADVQEARLVFHWKT